MATANPRRRPIPESVRRQVYIAAGYRCAVPTCRTILILDLHHIVPVRDGGPNTPENLLALCPTCHALFERRAIAPEAIRAWKAVLVTLNGAFDRATVDNLWFLRDVERHMNGRNLVMTGDGIGRYAPLFSAGLAHYARTSGYRGGLNVDYFEIQLSPKGRDLLSAWESGNEDAVRLATQSGTPPIP